MPGDGGRRRRRKGAGHGAEHADERWLLTYADMITLLMALFMVMFSMASVNTSKYEELTRSLQDAFSGKVLSGGTSFQTSGASPSETEQAVPEPPIPAIKPPLEWQAENDGGARAQELDDLAQVKRQVDQYAREHNLEHQVKTQIDRRGLVIRLLTDKVLFDSASATLKPRARPLLTSLAGILRAEVRHPVLVEGHTDNAPINTPQYPTNWELSTLRSTTVVRYLIREGVASRRLSAVGYGALRPIASNHSAIGRRRNRRVEIVLSRILKHPDTEVVQP